MTKLLSPLINKIIIIDPTNNVKRTIDIRNIFIILFIVVNKDFNSEHLNKFNYLITCQKQLLILFIN